MSIETRLQEIADELEQLRKANDACDYALHHIYNVESCLPNGICMSHHAGMEMEEVQCAIQERITELEYKIGDI